MAARNLPEIFFLLLGYLFVLGFYLDHLIYDHRDPVIKLEFLYGDHRLLVDGDVPQALEVGVVASEQVIDPLFWDEEAFHAFGGNCIHIFSSGIQKVKLPKERLLIKSQNWHS